MNEAANEHPSTYPNPEESVAYLDDIDAMSLEELEKRLPEAQEALETIESKLEELMNLRDSALVCAVAMTARLAALKQQAGERMG